MPLKPEDLRFFVDETSLGIGKALAIVRTDVVHTGHPWISHRIPLGAKDPDWMPVVAELGLAVISRDRRIKTKHAKMMRYRDHGLRVFWIHGKREIGNWDGLSRLVRRWDDIEKKLEERGPGPWFMAVKDRTVEEMYIKGLE